MLYAPNKSPLSVCTGRGLFNKESDDDLLSQRQSLLSLARERFTVLFGMGRGGSTLLWSSDERGGRRFTWVGLHFSKHRIPYIYIGVLLKIIGSSLTGN